MVIQAHDWWRVSGPRGRKSQSTAFSTLTLPPPLDAVKADSNEAFSARSAPPSLDGDNATAAIRLIGDSVWSMARIRDQPALPGNPKGMRAIWRALVPQNPSNIFAMIMGPCGGGLVISHHGNAGCRWNQIPRYSTVRLAWKGSSLSLMALACVIKPPRPTAVTAKESQLATREAVSVAIVLNYYSNSSWVLRDYVYSRGQIA
jgi:hypothetical protein